MQSDDPFGHGVARRSAFAQLVCGDSSICAFCGSEGRVRPQSGFANLATSAADSSIYLGQPFLFPTAVLPLAQLRYGQSVLAMRSSYVKDIVWSSLSTSPIEYRGVNTY